jgi:hypothetical protein
MSSKASPWQNGFQESYYRGFKEDLGSIKDCLSIGELLDRVFKTICQVPLFLDTIFS